MAHHNSNVGFFSMIGGSLLAAALLVVLLGWRRDCWAKSAIKHLAIHNCALSHWRVWDSLFSLQGDVGAVTLRRSDPDRT